VVLPIVYAAFEAAVVASEAVSLAGLDAPAGAAIRTAMLRYAPRAVMAMDSFEPAGGRAAGPAAATSAATGAALVAQGRLTRHGILYVAEKVSALLRQSRLLQKEFSEIQGFGPRFYPVWDDGPCLACGFTYKNIPRRFSMRLDDASDLKQLTAFLQACKNGVHGSFQTPDAKQWPWFRSRMFVRGSDPSAPVAAVNPVAPVRKLRLW
jgi:hypothetical protein